MEKQFYSLLKGTFLTDSDASKNWGFILFLSLLAIIMISSAHRADRKVMKISELNREVKSLRSEYVALKGKLMKLQLESTIRPKMEKRGIKPPENPPKKIRVVQTTNKSKSSKSWLAIFRKK